MTQHPNVASLLHHFRSDQFCKLALDMAQKLDGAELTAGLRKLLEAEDCFVRAGLDVCGEVKRNEP